MEDYDTFMIYYLGKKRTKPPAPQACVKCNAICPCVDFEEYPDRMGGALWIDTWACPVHGSFYMKDGAQCFDEPDVYVRGPNGERLFAI